MGSFIKRLLIVTGLVFLFSHFNLFVHVQSLEVALFVSFIITVFLFSIKLLADVFKVMGCFTFGITYIVGVIMSIFALPMSIYYAQDYVSGFAVKSFFSAVIFSIIVSIAQSLVDVKESE